MVSKQSLLDNTATTDLVLKKGLYSFRPFGHGFHLHIFESSLDNFCHVGCHGEFHFWFFKLGHGLASESYKQLAW
jgi:hypothetical protein